MHTNVNEVGTRYKDTDCIPSLARSIWTIATALYLPFLEVAWRESNDYKKS